MAEVIKLNNGRCMLLITAEEINEQAKANPNVQSDQARADKLKEEGYDLCPKCGGTGNELLFMYRQCSDCEGSGIDCIITGVM